MKREVCLLALCAAALVPSASWAQPIEGNEDTIIVTATRAPGGVRAAALGASVSILEPDDLRARQTRIIADVLRDVPSLAVNRTGGIGGQTQIRVRGGEANQTLVLIDGMEASNPFYGEFDFAALIADEVARVEVLRGQQSTLYGSDAIAVVHYMTLSAAEAPGASARLERGSSNSWDGALRIADIAGPLDFALSAGYQQTDGEPSARDGLRDIGAMNAALSGRFILTLNDNARLRAIGRYAYTEAETNAQDFDFPPGPTYGYAVDSDNFYENEITLALVSAEFDALDRRWRNALTLQAADAARRSFAFGGLSAHDQGARVKASYVSSLHFAGDIEHTLTGAIDAERETFRTQGPFLSLDQQRARDLDNLAATFEYDARAANWALGFALRRDDNERFADADTHRFQGAYEFAFGARLHAAAGSGVKNPGFYELFGFDPAFFIGNPDLKPERSEGWELGIEQTLFNGAARLDLTYFEAELEDEIFTEFVGPNFIASPANRAAVSTRRGVEIAAEAELGKNWRMHLTYANLDAEEGGEQEVRRPPHLASFNLDWRSTSDRFGAFFTARYNGEMQDFNFTLDGPPRIDLPAYTLVNVGGDIRISADISLYGRVENALDEVYEDVYTFRAPGRAGYIGLRARY